MRSKVMQPRDLYTRQANKSAMRRGKSAGRGSGAHLLCEWSLAGRC